MCGVDGGGHTRQLQQLPSTGQHRSLSPLLVVLRGRKGAFCSREIKDVREGVKKHEPLRWLGSILLPEDLAWMGFELDHL